MSKVFRRLLSFVLVVSLLLTANITAFAAAEEEYLSELRLVYAEDYSEAKEILEGTEFKDYVILNENLNEDTDEIGVWLAYKTTTDIEDAITDLSIMQMQGGFEESNYQQMLEESYNEYIAMGKIYLQAIDYFIEAYDADDFFAESAYRQLNFYTVETDKENTTQDPHPFEGELLGDIFYDGIEVEDLATIFMQGNTYALKNIRSLLAMGVSYNEDGKTYMEKVADEAQAMREDPKVYEKEQLSDLLPHISAVLTSLRNSFKDLESVEKEFDWEDDEFTADELKFAEITFVATLMRDTEYLDGKTLYQFVMDYTGTNTQDPKLAPLAVALNKGQEAMTKVFHYYDVIRYSISDMDPEVIEDELAEMEETYVEEPFNVYTGVDRSIFDGTFALTNAAYRANNMNEYSLEELLFGDAQTQYTKQAWACGYVGLGIMAYALCRTIYYKHVVNAADAAGYSANTAMQNALENIGTGLDDLAATSFGNSTYGSLIDDLVKAYDVSPASNSFVDQVSSLHAFVQSNPGDVLQADADVIQSLFTKTSKIQNDAWAYDFDDHFTYSKTLYGGGTALTTVLWILGGAMVLVSAVSIVSNIVNYYNPDYDDIPLSMVDMIETEDGDRFIKYDVVREAEAKKNGDYAAGDLNAFEAQRWNALYYTKSYEAGKPLLADEFSVSNSNNKPKTNYAPVHRFGEVICYDLNKYNFSDKSPSIYLSVKQSKNDKSAVADVPEVVGSVFGGGLWMLFGGAGALFGVGGTLGTQALLKKKREKKED